MLGAIMGDIIGSKYEFNNCTDENFELFSNNNFITDDTICTLAIAKAIINYKENNEQDKLTDLCASSLYNLCNQYKNVGYGSMFLKWLNSENPKPYNSYGNGAAMRIGAIPYFAYDVNNLAIMVNSATIITHNHPRSQIGANMVAAVTWLLLHHYSDEIIVKNIEKYYKIPPIVKIKFSEDIDKTVPICFSILLNSTSFEDAMRKSIMVGGDSDTIANIVGGMAEARFGIPKEIEEEFWKWDYLDDNLKNIYNKFLELKESYI